MKKKALPENENENEIIFNELLLKLWNGKIKLILIVLVSIVLGVIYNNNSQKDNLYEFSLKISKNNNSDLIEIIPVYSFLLEEYDTAQSQDQVEKYEYFKETVFKKFLLEFVDYDEVIIALKKNNRIKEKISGFSEEKKRIALYDYAKNFYIKEVRNKQDKSKIEYFIKFKWHDKDEGRKILAETLETTMTNLTKLIYEEFDNFYSIKKEQIINKDLNRIEYLRDQSELAKTLGIAESTIDITNLAESNFLFNINNSSPYYLRGHKVIDKEISLIKNRKYRELSNIKKQIKKFKNNKINKWIDYNTDAVNIKFISHKNTKVLIIFIISGIILGIFYVSITSSNQFAKIIKNK
jgi:LPS O-antigen subunit length determinant protein (WzzB/FepE family)